MTHPDEGGHPPQGDPPEIDDTVLPPTVAETVLEGTPGTVQTIPLEGKPARRASLRFKGSLKQATWSKDGVLASGGWSREVYLWDLSQLSLSPQELLQRAEQSTGLRVSGITVERAK